MLRDAKVHCCLSVGPVTDKFHSDYKVTFCCTLSKIMKIKVYISIIFRTVLYGFKSWSLRMRTNMG